MGYGHLRAAHALADALGTEVLETDRPPLADEEEQRLCAASRHLYELASRVSQVPVVGAPLARLLDAVTAIPHLHPRRDLSPPDHATRLLGRLIDRGLGRGLAAHLMATGRPLLTSYFVPALAADAHLPAAGAPPVWCVVTDADVARAWVPREPEATRVRYLVPSHRALRRLRAYGVPRERIEMTGFPLPGELLGDTGLEALRGALAGRLVRLDPGGGFRTAIRREIETFLGPLPTEEEGRPPHLVYAVGGAGAQAEVARYLLPSLAPWLRAGRVRLTLVAGIRTEVAARFTAWIDEAALAGRVDVLHEAEIAAYFRRFNRLLAGADVLWTKPSELTFYAALGLPLVFTRPVGVHEHYNRRWAIESGAGLKGRDLRFAGDWLDEWLADGTLAAAAWSGFVRLPKYGLHQVVERTTAPF